MGLFRKKKILGPVPLETPRLLLQGWEVEDAPALYDYAKNPHVGPNAGWKPHESVGESRQVIRQVYMQSTIWKIVWKENGEIIGSIGLYEDRRRPQIPSKELGYSLREEYWHMGIMTEAGQAILAYAFEDLQLDVVSIQTGTSNQRSQGVIENLGFVLEGLERKSYTIYNGTLIDEYVFSLLREEWEAMQEGHLRPQDLVAKNMPRPWGYELLEEE